MAEHVGLASSELTALVERSVAAAESRLRAEFEVAISVRDAVMASRLDELRCQLVEQEATINQLVDSSKEIYETSSQVMRTLKEDLTARGAEQEKDRRRVGALEQRLSVQTEELDTRISSHEAASVGCRVGANAVAELDSIQRRLAAVEVQLERYAADMRQTPGGPPNSDEATPTAAVAAVVAAAALDAGSPQFNECPSAMSSGADHRHQHGPIEHSPCLQLRSGSSEAALSTAGADMLWGVANGLEGDAYRQLLAAATEKAQAAATAAATLSVQEGTAEVGESAARQAAVAASDAVKRETDELATLVVTLLTGCRTELKRLADAFGVMRTRRQTSDQTIRSLAQKLQAMEKQCATEALASTRRIGGLSAAIETLATEVDSGLEHVAQQLFQVAKLHDVCSPSQVPTMALAKPGDAYKKVKRLLPPTD